jgi:membrane protease YdiL (CAAX protease family)
MTNNDWPAPQASNAVEPGVGAEHIAFSAALIGWLIAYAAAVVLGVSLSTATGQTDPENVPTWFIGVSALTLWVPFFCVLVYLSRTRGHGTFRTNYSLRFAWSDLVGIPLGVVSQLVIVNLATWPFRKLFPETFDPEQVSQRAKNLVDSANGLWLLLLAVVVVVGAPVIEELVYRGLLQKSAARSFGSIAAIFLVSAFFTVVHLVPVEFPGLFAFALILGFAFHRTQRIGLTIVTHMSFNAAGLLLVLLT